MSAGLLVTGFAVAPATGIAAADQTSAGPPVTYTAFDGHTETLTPWQGTNIAVLTEPGVTRSDQVMNAILRTLDRAWNYYQTTTGMTPTPIDGHTLNGRTILAEVTSTCGAGCGLLGATGVEMLTQYFELFYSEATQHLYDQVPFYEFGRNFWFYSPELDFHDAGATPVATGFAVFMRFRSMAAARIKGAPFNGIPFDQFTAQVADLAREYEADPAMTFASTLGSDHSPGLYGGSDFWASLMMQLAARHGGQTFVSKFFHAVPQLPAATTTAGAVANWVQAASTAACVDLSPVFYDRWGFPRPDGTTTARPAADSVPEPVGRC